MIGKLEGEEFSELRALWRTWDPIGVYADPAVAWPEGEYDAYLWPCLRVLAESEDMEAVESFLQEVVQRNLGLTRGSRNEMSLNDFACQLVEWFERRRLRGLG